MACKCFSRKVAVICLWVTLLILVLSIVLVVVFPTIYNSILKKEISLQEGTIVSNIWQDIPLPIYEKVYFFNITNKERFLNGSEPMNVTQVGPYVYKGRWVKRHPHWHPNNTVTYREKRIYHFVPHMSNGTEDDVIYTLNGPMIIAANMVKTYNLALRGLLSFLLGIEGEEVVIQRTIKELTYEGYDDIIIRVAPLVKPDIPYKEGKFCWLYGKNNTNDGRFTVFTGADNASKTNFINNWNGQEKLNFWKNDTCNMLNGTSIETGPPIKGHQDSYSFFQSIFCRSLTFNYTEEITHYGLAAKRFRPTYALFANGTENPDNHCFEVNGERASGVLDVSPCQFGAPVLISFPHFYMADSSYLNTVNGLNPNDDEHGSHLDVELLSGVSVDINVKFQINLEVKRIEGIFQLYNVTEGILPVLWVDLSLKIDEELADFFRSHIRNPKIIAYAVIGSIAGISLIIVFVLFVIVCRNKSDQDDDDCLISASDDIARIYNESLANKSFSDDDSDEKLIDSEPKDKRGDTSRTASRVSFKETSD